MPLDIFKLQGIVTVETARAERDLKNLDATARDVRRAFHLRTEDSNVIRDLVNSR